MMNLFASSSQGFCYCLGWAKPWAFIKLYGQPITDISKVILMNLGYRHIANFRFNFKASKIKHERNWILSAGRILAKVY